MGFITHALFSAMLFAGMISVLYAIALGRGR